MAPLTESEPGASERFAHAPDRVPYPREVTMAKRRNLKREKALRNEAYARKFRKRNKHGRGRRPRSGGPSSQTQTQNQNEEQQTTEAGAA